jgi:DNA-binding transcriptional ArsR family regulator
MEDQLSLTFSALADPTRRAILARLVQGDATVNQLAEPFDLRLPTVSKHLKVLQRAGLVAQGRKAQWRPCRLRAEPLKQAAEWVDRFRANWEERFEQLDTFLLELHQQEKHRDDNK